MDELAEAIQLRSSRLVQQLIDGVRSALPASFTEALQRTMQPGWAGAAGEEFPPVAVAAAVDGRMDWANSLMTLGTPQLGDFQGIGKKGLYLAAVKVRHQAALEGVRPSGWLGDSRPNSSLLGWSTLPVEKHTADRQWRIIYRGHCQQTGMWHTLIQLARWVFCSAESEIPGPHCKLEFVHGGRGWV